MKSLRFLILAALVAASAAGAQSFPDKSKPLRMIVPSGVGSTGDVVARAYGAAITEVAGMPVLVENKPGAEGVIGVQAVKAAAPDGYTIMLTSNSTQVLNVHMLPKLPYDPVADFVPLVGTGKIPLVMAVGAGSPFKTVQDFIAAARGAPGKYSFGSNTATGRMAVEMLEHMAGIKLLPVLYKTQPDVFTAMSSGQIDMAFGTEASMNAFIKGGRIRPVAVSGNARLKTMPGVPTLQEAGLREYEFTSWLATFAPAGTPPAVVATLREIVRKAGQTRTVTDLLHSFGVEPMELAGDELMAMQRSEIAKWAQVVKSSGQRPQ